MFTLTRKLFYLLVTVVVVMGGWWVVVPAQSTYAQTIQGQEGELTNEWLALAYDRLVFAHQNLNSRIGFANQAADLTQQWIDNLKAEGKDTSSLEAALQTFRTSLATTQTYADQAGSILATHAGFDDEGNVLDREQARTTLREVRQQIRDGNHTLADATRTFHTTVKDYLHSQ